MLIPSSDSLLFPSGTTLPPIHFLGRELVEPLVVDRYFEMGTQVFLAREQGLRVVTFSFLESKEPWKKEELDPSSLCVVV